MVHSEVNGDMWGFPSMRLPKNERFLMENRIILDDPKAGLLGGSWVSNST